MARAMRWLPAGPSGPLRIDWNTLGLEDRFDLYVAWLDQMVLAPAARDIGVPLILELRNEYDSRADVHVKQWGLSITRHYRHYLLPNKHSPRYVTATCQRADSLRQLFDAVLSGRDPWVLRYEVSTGFANPDDEILESGAPPAVGKLEGPLVGFIDYGCAFLNRQFRDAFGNSRLHALWDPDARPSARGLRWQPEPWFGRGGVADADALQSHECRFTSLTFGLNELDGYRTANYPSALRFATHGAHVMDIATGYPDPTRPFGLPGEQHGAKIVFAQMPRFQHGVQVSGLLRAQVLDAAHFVAAHLDDAQPGVINLSYGSNCGPHDGTSILERGLDELLDAHRDSNGAQRLHLALPSGNAADRAGHAQLLVAAEGKAMVKWVNVPNDPSDSFVELWAPAQANLYVHVTAPNGMACEAVRPGQAQRLDRNGGTLALLVASAMPCQADEGVMWLLAVAPTTAGGRRPAAPYGTWQIEIENRGSSEVCVDAWCERDDPVFGQEAGPRQAFFADHVVRTGTLNSIAHGRFTTVVGGFHMDDSASRSVEGPVATMSGTGPGRGLAGRDRHDAAHEGHAVMPGPQVLAPCSLSSGDDGLPGTAVMSGDSLRLTGTSVSAAYWTRKFIENKFRPPKPQDPSPDFHAIPGRDAHPDDELATPRIR